MRSLMSANFYRIWKSKIFYIELLGTILVGIAESVVGAVQHRIHLSFGALVCVDSILFGYALFVGFFTSIFCSLFIGTEYSDGTLRNKIIAGHKRESIYFSNLFTSIAAILILCVVYLVVVVAVGVPFMGGIAQSPAIILLKIFGTIILSISFCSLFTMVSMLVPDKTIVAIIGLLATAFFSVVAFVLNDYSGWMREEHGIKYLTCTFFHSFLPMGQAIQYADVDYNALPAERIVAMILCSLLISVLSTVIGVRRFLEKSVK